MTESRREEPAPEAKDPPDPGVGTPEETHNSGDAKIPDAGEDGGKDVGEDAGKDVGAAELSEEPAGEASEAAGPAPRRSAARAGPRYSASRRIKLPEGGLGSGTYKLAGPGSGVYALSGGQHRLSSGKYSVLRKRRESGLRSAPRLGDAFVEAESEPDFELELLDKDRVERSFKFRGEVATIGREANADICIDNLLVSRLHAEIRRHHDLYALVDLKSPNGSFVNGKKVKDLIILNDGDLIVIGKARLRFKASAAAELSLPEMPSQGVGTSLGELTLQMSNKTRDRVLVEDKRPKGYVAIGGARRFVEELFQVGAAAECDLKLGGLFAPRKAALIVRGATEYRLINVTKPGAVLVNDAPLADAVVLKDGDRLRVRGVAMRFELGEAEA